MSCDIECDLSTLMLKSFQSPFVRCSLTSPYSINGSARSRSCLGTADNALNVKNDCCCFAPPTAYFVGAAAHENGVVTLVTTFAVQRIRNNIRDSGLSLS